MFGDSLVDAGNNDYLFTLSKANSPPYGIHFKPSGGQPTRRFTNGRTVSDIIGEALGGSNFCPPFLAPNSLPNAFQSGINYASGSSGILSETGSLFGKLKDMVDLSGPKSSVPLPEFHSLKKAHSETHDMTRSRDKCNYSRFIALDSHNIQRIPLQEQVSYFEKTRNYMVYIIGEDGTTKFSRNAHVSLTIGSIDMLNYIQPSIPFLGQDKAEPVLFQEHVISNLTTQLKAQNLIKCTVHTFHMTTRKLSKWK
ncbi:hypothetical protein Ancab_033313 [Ancistrocladus abbreviatus]